MTKVNVAPSTHMINSFRKQRMETNICFAELIDNSFDAEAEEVKISTKDKAIIISDNGLGVSDLKALARFGGHEANGRSTSGRYGVGGTEALCNLGGQFIVHTIRNQCKAFLSCDFELVEKSGEWEVDIEEEGKAGISEKSGTEILITNLTRRSINVPALLKKLGQIFSPAISKGKKIIINGILVEPIAEIKLEQKIEGEGIYNGKSYKWFAGLIPDGSKVSKGWNIALRNRMMEGYQSAGMPAGSSITKFYGYIELIEDDISNRWNVDKHKTTAEEIEAICSELYSNIQPLIEKCNDEISCDVLNKIANNISNILNNFWNEKSDVKQKRRKKENEKNEEEDDKNYGESGRKILNICDYQPGIKNLIIKNLNKVYAVKWENICEMYEIQSNQKNITINLGRNHPYWVCVKNNPEINEFASLGAITQLIHYLSTFDDNNQPWLLIMEKHKGSQFQNALATIDSIFAKLAYYKNKLIEG